MKPMVLQLITSVLLASLLVGCTSSPKSSSQNTPSHQQSAYLKLRESAPDFWRWSAENLPRYISTEFSEVTGWVTGDPHFKNFGDIQTENSVQFGLIDLDDAGQGPLLLDLVRFIASAKSMGLPIDDINQILNQYFYALTDPHNKKPKPIEIISAEKGYNFFARLNDYAISNSRKNKLKRKELNLTDISGKENIQPIIELAVAHIKNLQPQLKLLDVAIKTKNSGGSRGLERIWLLFDFGIFELKPIAAPATGEFSNQTNHVARLNNVLQTYWAQVSQYYKIIGTNDSQYYWLRPKLKDFIQHDKMTKKQTIEFLVYAGAELGYRHRQQLDKQQLSLFLRHEADIRRQTLNMAVAWTSL